MVSSTFGEAAESRTINYANKNSASFEFYLALLTACASRPGPINHEKSPRFRGLDLNTLFFYEAI